MMNIFKSYYEQEALWNKDLTLQEKERIKLLNHLIPNDVETILDAGCGNGAISNFLKGYKIIGIDISFKALKFFKHNKVLGNLANLPFKDKSFDLVICSDTLEHIPEKDFNKVISELKRVTKKYILIISPNDEDLEANQTKCWNCGTIFHINWHIRSLNLDKLINLFRDEFSPIVYTFFGDYWTVEPKVKYRLKRLLNKGYKYWENAVCPLCGEKQTINNFNEDTEIDKFLDLKLNNHLRDFFLEKTEVAVLFVLKDLKEKKFNFFFKNRNNYFIMSSKEKLKVYNIDKFYIKVGEKGFEKNFTVPYPPNAYILVNEQSGWSEIEKDEDGAYRKLSSHNNRALAIFPLSDYSSKNLFIVLKPEETCIFQINVYDLISKYKKIIRKKITKKEKQILRVKIPKKLNLPNEGLIFEFLVYFDLDCDGSLYFYDIYLSSEEEKVNKEINQSIYPINKIKFFGKEMNLFKVQSFEDKPIFIFEERYNYFFDYRRKSFVLVNESILDTNTINCINKDEKMYADDLLKHLFYFIGEGNEKTRTFNQSKEKEI